MVARQIVQEIITEVLGCVGIVFGFFEKVLFINQKVLGLFGLFFFFNFLFDFFYQIV